MLLPAELFFSALRELREARLSIMTDRGEGGGGERAHSYTRLQGGSLTHSLWTPWATARTPYTTRRHAHILRTCHCSTLHALACSGARPPAPQARGGAGVLRRGHGGALRVLALHLQRGACLARARRPHSLVGLRRGSRPLPAAAAGAPNAPPAECFCAYAADSSDRSDGNCASKAGTSVPSTLSMSLIFARSSLANLLKSWSATCCWNLACWKR